MRADKRMDGAPARRDTPMIVIGVAVVLGALYLLIRCANAPAPAEQPTPTPMPSRCVRASEKQMAEIRLTVRRETAGNNVRDGWAVQSREADGVWMVAALVYGPTASSGAGPGVWAMTGELDRPIHTYSVNPFAIMHSNADLGLSALAEYSMTTDGAEEAEACVR